LESAFTAVVFFTVGVFFLAVVFDAGAVFIGSACTATDFDVVLGVRAGLGPGLEGVGLS